MLPADKDAAEIIQSEGIIAGMFTFVLMGPTSCYCSYLQEVLKNRLKLKHILVFRSFFRL